MHRFLRAHLGTVAVAAITAGLVAAAPALASTIVNADRVGGFRAVGCHKSPDQRAGKLVATCPFSGRLPNNIISRAPNSALLNGLPASSFYRSGSTVADSNLLDGKDSTAFYATGSKVADSDLLDGKDSTAFLLTTGKAADADKLDGHDSTEFLLGTTTNGRNSSCSGSQFYPVDGSGYATSASLRFSTVGAGFRCSEDLPQNAIVTSVSFSVNDSAAGSVGPCQLVRTNLVSSIGAETVMADAGTTTGTSGAQRITDSSISSSSIDNANFAYYLTCTITGTTSAEGIYGASIGYTITNSNG